MAEQYIFSENNKYVVKNRIDGECVIFGSFDKLEDAIELRDELEDYGWPYSKLSSQSLHKIEPNIFEEDGSYIVSKKISDFEIVFGKFKSLRKAQSYKRKLIENAWNLNFPINSSKYGRYIRKDKTFIVNRTIKGEYINYGAFKFLDEAIYRRDNLIDNNWGMDDKYILYNLGITELNGRNHNIGKVGRNYIVFKWEDMRCTFLAMLSTLSLAVKFRDKLDLNKKSNSLGTDNYYLDNRHIHKFKDGFTIFKRINGELIHFGFFEEFEDAVEYRDFLEENNWIISDDESSEEKFDEYIYIKNNGKYYVKNEINGEMRIFGVFDDPLDAVAARLDCIKANWELPYVSENEEEYNKLDSSASSEIKVIDEFSENISFEEFISNSLNFPVTVGKSYKNNGWAIKRRYLIDLIPVLPYEKLCKVFFNGIEVIGKLNIHTRLFYSKNEILVDYLKKLFDIDPMTQTRIDFRLNHGIYEKSPGLSGKRLAFKTNFSKNFKEGFFTIPRTVTKNILPILQYEEQCNFLINNIEVKGKFNLEFRFKFTNNEIISELEDQINDGEELEVVLIL